MNTPILDFLNEYQKQAPLRLHMPGHKGSEDPFDITEVTGADSLYEAEGIIAQSEENAGRLFGANTFYSTEGSSQCIRAMLYLTLLWAKEQGKRPLIAAGRNAHKTFMTGAALLGLEVCWLWPKEGSYLSCALPAEEAERILREERPAALYLTSPDYLGNRAELGQMAALCKKYGALLLVDNAHGAYLKFLPESLHPMDLGADLCCDSAHKTLPVLTGGAYLHLRKGLEALAGQAKAALALFGSTSPSYLILASMDRVNGYLENYPQKLAEFLPAVKKCKTALTAAGYELKGKEPLKITLAPKSYGYTGTELADYLQTKNMVCEFADPDFLVLMVTPETGAAALNAVQGALLALPKRSPILQAPPDPVRGEQVLPIRQAALAPFEELPVAECLGRILASPSVGCPPAVPIALCGERLEENTLRAFEYYGIKTCKVVKGT